jgi:cobalt-zinc-cadmium efflux system membrane fusion protein
LQEAEADRAKAEAGLQQARQSLTNLGLSITQDAIQGKSQHDLRRQLQFLGLPPKTIADFDPLGTTGNLIPVVAPRDGVVVRRDVVAGEVVDTTRPLFTIVDTSRMWLTLSVPMEDARLVRIGQKVLFRPDGMTETHTGAITWTSPEVDAVTRTVSVRAELENSDGDLLNEIFGRGQVVLREEPNTIVAPTRAVHWEGCCHVVFVRDKDFLKEGAYKVFHTRMVRPGVALGDDRVELLAGVLPGEVVVTKGSSVLRAELLKGNLGAG